MATWEVHDGKQQVGPLEEDHVIRMIESGLPETTMVRPSGSQKWKNLRVHAPFAMALERAAGATAGPPAQALGYGPPPGYQGQGYPPPGAPGYQAQGYAPPPQVPQKKGLSTAALIAIVASVVIMGPCVLCMFAGAISSTTKSSREGPPTPNATSPGQTSSPAPPAEPPRQAAKGPPEPEPPSAALASEVTDITAKLAADKAYQGIWTPPRRTDLKVLLTALSQLLASTTTAGAGRMTTAAADALKARKLFDAAGKLYMILARQNSFPSDFTQNFNDLLAASKNEPNLGVWSPDKGTGQVDFAALAAWSHRTNPAYLRALLDSKKNGPVGWPDTDNPIRPWLATEKDALKALANLGPLTAAEKARLNELLASKYADIHPERVQIGTLLSEYKGNEVRADAAYKGKVIQTTGIVDTVKKDITDSIYVTLGTGAMFEIPVVQCFFDDRLAKKAAALNKGDRVTVRGTVSGLMMNVLVKECEFVD